MWECGAIFFRVSCVLFAPESEPVSGSLANEEEELAGGRKEAENLKKLYCGSPATFKLSCAGAVRLGSTYFTLGLHWGLHPRNPHNWFLRAPTQRGPDPKL